jgi:hypothetical protein
MQSRFSKKFVYSLQHRVTPQKNKVFKILHRGFSFLDIFKMSIFQKPTRLYFLCFYNVLNNSTKSSQKNKLYLFKQ